MTIGNTIMSTELNVSSRKFFEAPDGLWTDHHLYVCCSFVSNLHVFCIDALPYPRRGRSRTACPAKGIAWPVTAGLYLVSDVTLAVAFEPILQFIAWLGGKVSG